MKRIALLVGNDEYSNLRNHLDCAVNDATELSNTLKTLSFKTSLLTNVTCSELTDGLMDYVRDLNSYDVGLFFFAGHGFQVKGENYLGCTDTQFEDEVSIKYTGYRLQNIIEELENSQLKIKILIIDACRSYVSGARGLNSTFAPILAPKGTIIAFATSPGQTAKEDAKSGHGYFTKALLNHIKAENISIEDMFKRVRNTVYIETSGKQITWEHTSLLGEFSFNDFSKLESEIPYSEFALADEEYEPVNNGICFDLIQLAIKHDWNYQNLIPNRITKNIEKFKQEDPDDIFVLGRNLYQSSNDPFEIISYFDDLHTNLGKLPQSVACHLLSGMAYEIFFGNDGKLRKVFKTHIHYKKVLSELKDSRYDTACKFIYGQLEQYKQQIICMPSKSLNLEIHIEKFDTNFDEIIYRVTSIYTDGINVMYEMDGKDFYDATDDYRYNDLGISIEDCKAKILERVAGTKRDVKIHFVNDTDADLDNLKICWSNNFWLIRYTD